MLMGMMVMLSRKRAITKVLGFLSMENGVLLFGIFVTELPFIIEFLIIIDLIILVLLTTILTVGIDSTLEDYHKRLHRFHLWEGPEEAHDPACVRSHRAPRAHPDRRQADPPPDEHGLYRAGSSSTFC